GGPSMSRSTRRSRRREAHGQFLRILRFCPPRLDRQKGSRCARTVGPGWIEEAPWRLIFRRRWGDVPTPAGPFSAANAPVSCRFILDEIEKRPFARMFVDLRGMFLVPHEASQKISQCLAAGLC